MTPISGKHSRPSTRLGALLASLAVVAPAAVLAPAPATAATPTCQGYAATIVGTAGDDVLRGTPGDDVIVGLAGHDRLVGRGGKDLLCGGRGMDVLLGGPGDDGLHGGQDGFITPFDADKGDVYGDYLEGGPGADRLHGGRDPRQGTGKRNHPDVISYAHAERGVTVDLRSGRAAGDGSDSIASGLVEILGTRHQDTVKAGRYPLKASTGAGNDTIIGSAKGDVLSPDSPSTRIRGVRLDPSIGKGGSDTVRARGGNDEILSIRGQDRLFGGTGNDSVASFSGRIAVASAGDGRDRISVRPRLGDDPMSVTFGSATDSRQDALYFDLRESSPLELTWSLTEGVLSTGDRDYRVEGARTIFWGTDDVRSRLTVTGTPRVDDLNAQDSGPVDFIAGGGADTFFGSVEPDRFDGGAGDDTYDYDASIEAGSNECVDVERDDFSFCSS